MSNQYLLLPEKRRAKHAPPFQLTERDKAIVQAVHHYRMLERRQVEALFFTSASGQQTNTSYARKRLRYLHLHSYLERILRPIDPSQGSRGPVYRLGPKGAQFLAGQSGILLSQFRYWGRGDDRDSHKTQVQPMFLEHGLALADVRMAFEKAAKRNACQIETWLDEMDIRHAPEHDSVTIALPDTPRERVAILPDGYFLLATMHGRGHFFLEVDRSTETINRKWTRKILGYKEYVRSGGFHKRYGASREQTALRILTTTISLQRAQNLKTAVERYGPVEMSAPFYFAPLNEVLASESFASPIWLRAGSNQRHAIF